MRFKFVGDYTNGATSITINGVTFNGTEPSDVPEELAFRFKGSKEFAAVTTKKKTDG